MYNQYKYQVTVHHDIDDEYNTSISTKIEVEAPNSNVAFDLAELWLWRHRQAYGIDHELDFVIDMGYQPGEEMEYYEAILTPWDIGYNYKHERSG